VSSIKKKLNWFCVASWNCDRGHEISVVPTDAQIFHLDLVTDNRRQPGIVMEIRWCPAHKGVEGNEKADEWAKLAAEEPDTHGVEWLNYDYGGRTEVRSMPLPRSLANLKREISEKKWTEARRWVGARISRKKYKMPESHKPDGTVAKSTKRLASRYCQLKTGHARTGQYLNWAKVRPTAQCW